MRKNIVIPIILIFLGLLMLTVFNESLNQINNEAFDFISALMLGVGIGMLLKIIFPLKKKTD
jgi:hypothetical protein